MAMESAGIAILIMVKNEREKIVLTLNSTKDISNIYFIYDTGSNDGTQDVIKDWC